MTVPAPILDEAMFDQVVTLLSRQRTCDLLQILRTRIVEMSELTEAEVKGALGRAHAHRLASEAGLLGFRRLSAICTLLDGRSVCISDQIAEATSDLRSVLELSHAEVCRHISAS